MVAPVADNDVIEQRDPKYFTGRSQPPRERDIVGRWRRIAGRVIVALMCRRSSCGHGRWEPPITRVTPIRYLQYSSAEPAERFVHRHFSEVSGSGIVPLVVPTVLAGLATWAAWRQRLLGLSVVTLVFFGFCFITGFSIGAAYVPIARALLVATLISAAGRAVARMRKGAV